MITQIARPESRSGAYEFTPGPPSRGSRSRGMSGRVPGFTRLNAYRQDHIILVDGSAWTSTGGPLLMNRLVDDVRNALG